MIDFGDYARLDALGLAELIRRGDATVAEVRETALAAIERFNPKLNAVLSVLEAESQREIEAGLPEAAMTGVPFLIKEVGLHAAGVPCRMGSRLCDGLSFPHDTELMKRFRAAGLVTVGTTQTPEFGYSGTTEPVAFGPVNNPWREGISAGGSSGGSGAAVASRIVPVAHANDGGGSIRIPAASNGLVGLKPTRDRTPSGPDTSDPLFGHAIEFVVSRSVRDSAALLDAVCGPDTGAPHHIAPPARPYLEEISRNTGRLTIAVLRQTPFGDALHPECRAAIEAASRLLDDLGHEIVESDLSADWPDFTENIHVIWCAFVAANVEAVARATGRVPSLQNLESASFACYEAGKSLSATDVLRALGYFNGVSRRIGADFERFDVLLTPTSAQPPPPHGTIDQNRTGISAIEWTQETFRFFPFTPLFNATGQPAISLPLYWSDDGLPIGLQFVGQFADEATLFRLAAQLEKAAPWADRLPPLSAAI